jgi:hypothetical protein
VQSWQANDPAPGAFLASPAEVGQAYLQALSWVHNTTAVPLE